MIGNRTGLPVDEASLVSRLAGCHREVGRIGADYHADTLGLQLRHHGRGIVATGQVADVDDDPAAPDPAVCIRKFGRDLHPAELLRRQPGGIPVERENSADPDRVRVTGGG